MANKRFKAEYSNDATGKKLETQYVSLVQGVYNPLIPGEIMNGLDVNELDLVTINGTAYIGNMEYTINRYFDWDVSYAPKSVFTLNRVHNPEGYTTYANLKINKTGPIYHYYRRDHLGNNREVWQAEHLFNNKPKLASTIQRTQYYPSGLPWRSNTADGAALQPYKYGGKEFVETHGYDSYDFHARNMYPAIMRFTTIDPLAVKYYSISPYAYVMNNPVRYVDPDGRKVVVVGIKEYRDKVKKDIVQLRKDNTEIGEMIEKLIKSPHVHYIKMPIDDGYNYIEFNKEKQRKGIPQGSVIRYDPDKKETADENVRTPRVGLAHEFQHADDLDSGQFDDKIKTETGVPLSEVDAINTENKIREKTGDEKRTTYGNKKISNLWLVD